MGPSCWTGRAWAVRLSDGGTIFTHGPDVVPVHLEPGTPWPRKVPSCITDPTISHHYAIYAHPIDKPNRFSVAAEQIRDLVAAAVGKLNEEAAAWGRTMDLPFMCDEAIVRVANETLPVLSAADDFAKIAAALRQKGHLNPNAKYWVHWDDTIPDVGGQGEWRDDDRPAVDNQNNIGPRYALTYGIWGNEGARIMLHEAAHTLGAVQHSAPNSSGAAHCNDEQDVMCYADGGPRSDVFFACEEHEHFDCGHDDYFNLEPTQASYLSSHWNVGAPINRFVAIGPNEGPSLVSFWCDPDPPLSGSPVTCQIAAGDPHDSRRLVHRIDWRDGNVTEVCCAAAPSDVQVNHTYVGVVPDAVDVWLIDSSGLSLHHEHSFVIEQPSQPPAIDELVCSPVEVPQDEPISCSVRASDPDGDSVAIVLDWDDGSTPSRVPGFGFATTPVATIEHALRLPGTLRIRATPIDGGGIRGPTFEQEIEAGCFLDARGEILVGAPVTSLKATQAWVAPVGSWCAGHSFRLEGAGALDDLDVCWWDSFERIACHAARSFAAETGTIPLGAQEAQVFLFSGLNTAFSLRTDG